MLSTHCQSWSAKGLLGRYLTAVRQVRHSNNCSLLFLVIDLVYFPSLLPSNALEQARKQGGWAVRFGVSTSVLPKNHIARRALAKQPRHTGQGGLSWHLRSCPHRTNVWAQYRPFSQFRRHSTLGIPSAQQLVSYQVRFVLCEEDCMLRGCDPGFD